MEREQGPDVSRVESEVGLNHRVGPSIGVWSARRGKGPSDLEATTVEVGQYFETLPRR